MTCIASVPKPRMTDKRCNLPLEPRVCHTPFIVHGKVNGKFARMLVDTGCNTLLISSSWVSRAGVKTYEANRQYNVQWGNRKGQYDATRLICVDVSVFTEEKKTWSESSVPLIVAPLRVDVILGLPFIFSLNVTRLWDDVSVCRLKDGYWKRRMLCYM